MKRGGSLFFMHCTDLFSGNTDEARALVAAEQREIELYERYKLFYGYGVYIAKTL